LTNHLWTLSNETFAPCSRSGRTKQRPTAISQRNSNVVAYHKSYTLLGEKKPGCSIMNNHHPTVSSVTSAISLGRGLVVSPTGTGEDSVHMLDFSDAVDNKLSTSGHSTVASTVCSSDDDEDSYDVEQEKLDGEWSSSQVDKTVQLWDLNLKERAELERMGRRLKDIDHRKNKPSEVIRFLRVRPGNVNAAETMFRNMIAWRMENKVDTIVRDYQPPKELLDYFPGAMIEKFDKDGDVIYVGRDGSVDALGLLKHYGHDEMIRFAIWFQEKVETTQWFKEYELKHGHPIKCETMINDVSGQKMHLLMNRGLRRMYGEMLRLDQDYYPEKKKRIIVIGVPNAFMMAWNAIKIFFDDSMVEKMVFANSRNAQKVLSKYVDLEVLPEFIAPGIGKGKQIEGMTTSFEGGPFVARK